MPLLAGRYPASGTQNFNGAGPIANLGDGTSISSSNTGTDGHPAAVVLNNALRLTQNGTGNTSSSFKLPDLDPGKAIDSWDATFKVRMSASSTPADGWSLNVGPIPGGTGGGEGGFAMSQGLVIAFDTYQNSSADPPSIEVFANGISVGNFPQTFTYDATFRDLSVHWDSSGLDITYTRASSPVVVCQNLATPGYEPAAGHTFAFSARTGGATQDTYIDALVISTTPLAPLETGGPVISEFAADNADALEDENGDNSDWIEIYNGQSTPASLSGWFLTDDSAAKTKWAFPSVQIPAYSYLLVFASDKNRTVAGQPLHTNFKLSSSAGYLALVRPGGSSSASEFNYGAQAQDVTYGLLGSGSSHTYGYLETPTPGRKNQGLQAAGPPAEEVVFLKDGQPISGGLYAANFSLAIQAPASPGAVVRYTTNNTVPTASSPAYSAPFTVNATATVRARIFAPDRLPGPVGSRTFLKLGSSLTNYHGSGQPFSSNLPIIVFDSFGVPVDQYSDPGAARPFRSTYAVVIDKDAVSSGRAIITGPANFQGRGGTHVRGESSSGFPQKSYSWETWNNEDEDKAESILGFPVESDWVLHAPYTDKTLMRNYLIYDRMRALNGNASAMGVKFVEVFFNQGGGSLNEDAYRGVYVLVEKIKRDSARVNIAKLNEFMNDPAQITGGYIFKKDKPGIDMITFNTSTYGQQFQFVEPDFPTSAQRTWLSNHVNAFEAALAGSNYTNPATGYAAYIDPPSFIDNQWFVEIAKQIDGYRLSTYFYKDRNAKIHCAPLWDYNLSLFNADYLQGDIHSGWYYTQLGGGDYYYWPRLLQDANYRLQHWDRYWELRRGIFETTAILNYIDGLASQLVNGSATPVTNSMANLAPAAENPAMRHFRKWPILGTYVWPNAANSGNRTRYWNGATLNPPSYSSANAEVDAMKNFLRRRLEWIDDQNFTGTTIYRPPVFSHYGGTVPQGTSLSISRHTGTAPSGYSYVSGGTIYYTTDGSDPRASNGALSATAAAYSTPLTLNAVATVKARLRNGSAWSPLTSATFIINAPPASAANTAITEIHYKPLTPAPGSPEYQAGYTAGNQFEYVEIMNVSGGHVDFSNCRFTQGITFDFGGVDPAKLIVPPGGRVLVVSHEGGFLARYGSGLAAQVLGTYSGNLSNEGETVTLLAADGSPIASVRYGITEPWPVAAEMDGYSLVLNNPAPNPGYTAERFRASAQAGGTPGAAAGPSFTGDPTADTDRDGMGDLLEFATGSSPGNSASVALPEASWQEHTVDGVTGTYLTFSHRRNNAADGVNCFVEISDALSGWSTSGMAYVSTVNNGDGTSTVTWRAQQPAASASRQFVRLRAAQP